MVGNRQAETFKHSVIKHLVASILERRGHKVSIEHKIGSKGILDVFDHNTGLAYEIQTISLRKNAELDRVRNYCNYAEVRDVIFINLKDIEFNFPIETLCQELEEKI